VATSLPCYLAYHFLHLRYWKYELCTWNNAIGARRRTRVQLGAVAPCSWLFQANPIVHLQVLSRNPYQQALCYFHSFDALIISCNGQAQFRLSLILCAEARIGYLQLQPFASKTSRQHGNAQTPSGACTPLCPTPNTPQVEEPPTLSTKKPSATILICRLLHLCRILLR
jgi:hypothetical protein